MEIDEVIEQKKEISIEMFKNTPKLISLMGTFKNYGIDTDKLKENEITALLTLILIASR